MRQDSARSLLASSGQAAGAGFGTERPVLESLEDRKLLFSLTIDPDMYLAELFGVVGNPDDAANVYYGGFDDDFVAQTDASTGLTTLTATGTGDGLATVSATFGYLVPTLGSIGDDDITRSDPEEVEIGFDDLLTDADGNDVDLSTINITANPNTTFFGPNFGLDTNILITISGGVSNGAPTVAAGFEERPNIALDDMDMREVEQETDDAGNPTGVAASSDDVDLRVDFFGSNDAGQNPTGAVNSQIEFIDDGAGNFTRNPNFDASTRPYVSVRLATESIDNGDGTFSPGGEFLPLFQTLYNASDNVNPLTLLFDEMDAVGFVGGAANQTSITEVVSLEFFRGGQQLTNLDYNNDGLPGTDLSTLTAGATDGEFADAAGDGIINSTTVDVDDGAGNGPDGIPDGDLNLDGVLDNADLDGDGVVDREADGTYRLTQVVDVEKLRDGAGEPIDADLRDEPEDPFGLAFGKAPNPNAADPNAAPDDPTLTVADLSTFTVDDVYDEIRFVFTPTQVGQTASLHVDDLTLLSPAGDFAEELENNLAVGIVTLTGPIGASANFVDLYDRPLYSRQVFVDTPDNVTLLLPNGTAEANVFDGSFEVPDLSLVRDEGVPVLSFDVNDDGRPDGRVQTFDVLRDFNGDGSFGGFLDVNSNGVFDAGDIPESTQDFNGDGVISPFEQAEQRVFEAGVDGLGRIELLGFDNIDPVTGNDLDTSRFSFTMGGGTLEPIPDGDQPTEALGPSLTNFFTFTPTAGDSNGNPRFATDGVNIILPGDEFGEGIGLDDIGLGFALDDNGDAVGLAPFSGNGVVGSPIIRPLTPPTFDGDGETINGAYLTDDLLSTRHTGASAAAQLYLDTVLRQGIRVGRALESFDFEVSQFGGSVFGSTFNTAQFAGSGIDILRPLGSASDAVLTAGGLTQSLTVDGEVLNVSGNANLGADAQVLDLSIQSNDSLSFRRQLDPLAAVRGTVGAVPGDTPGSFDSAALLGLSGVRLEVNSVVAAGAQSSFDVRFRRDTDGDGVAETVVQTFSGLDQTSNLALNSTNGVFDTVEIVNSDPANTVAIQLEAIELIEAPANFGDITLDAAVFGDVETRAGLIQYASVLQLSSVRVGGDLGRFVVSSDAGYIDDPLDPDIERNGSVIGSSLEVGRALGNFAVGGRSFMDVTVSGLVSQPEDAPTSVGFVYSEMERVLEPFIGRDGTVTLGETDLYGLYLFGDSFVDTDPGEANPSGIRAPIVGSSTIRNDSIGSAEFVNGSSGGALIVGEIGGTEPFVNTGVDTVDVFAFATDGTKPVVIENLIAGDAPLGFETNNTDVFVRVVDSEGIVVASEQRNDRGIRTDDRIEFTPTEPGVYYLIVGSGDNPTAQGTYTIAMQGLAPVTLGAYRVGLGQGETADLTSTVATEDTITRLEVAGGNTGLIAIGTGHVDGTGAFTNVFAQGGILTNEPEAAQRNIREFQVDLAGDLFQFNAHRNITGANDPSDDGDSGNGTGVVSINVAGDLAQFYTGRADDGGRLENGGNGAVGFGDVTQLSLEVGGRIGRFDVGGGLGTDRDGTVVQVGGDYSIRTGIAEDAISGDIGVFRTQFIVQAGTQSTPQFTLDLSASSGSGIGLISINELGLGAGANFGFNNEPNIILGEGGDIRFFDVPQIVQVAAVSTVTLETGVAQQFVDDAGGVVTLIYTQGTDEDDDGNVTATGPGTAVVTVVPIDGSAGVAIARIEADLSLGGSLQVISSAAAGTNDVISIGRIFLSGADEDSQVLITGGVEVDVWQIQQQSSAGAAGGDAMGTILNSTPGGDIVAIDVQDLGSLQIVDGNLGRTQTQPYGPSRISPFLGLASAPVTEVGGALGYTQALLTNVGNASLGILRPSNDGVQTTVNFYDEDLGLPLDPYLDGLVVRSGNAEQVLVGRGVGDVIVQSGPAASADAVLDADGEETTPADPGAGNITLVIANNLANLDPSREFSGIFGNIYATDNIVEVRVGDGLLGRADTPLLDVGIVAENSVQRVVAGGGGAGQINGASIDGVIVGVGLGSGESVDTVVNGVVVQINGIGEVLVTGGGGMTGAYLGTTSLDEFFTGAFIDGAPDGPGDIARIEVRGLGTSVFGTEISAGDILQIDIDGAFDASSINATGELGRVTSANNVDVISVTTFGEIRNSTLGGAISEVTPTIILVGDRVQRIDVAGDISDLVLEVNESIIDGVTARNIARTQFNVDNSISQIITSESFLASSVVAGELRLLRATGAIRASTFEVSGTLDVFEAAGDITAVDISVTGPSGQINRIESLGGSIRELELLSSGPVQTLRAAVDLGGSLTTTDPNDAVTLIQAGRDLLIETDFAGNVNQLIAGRNIGAPGVEDTIRVRGNLSQVTAGAATVAGVIDGVDGSGQIYSDIRVDLDITGTVTIDGLPGNFPLGTPEIVAFGRVNQVNITGDFRGLIRSASNGIGDIDISGSLLEGGLIRSDDGSLGSGSTTGLTVGGDLIGDVFVERSAFLISVGGNLGAATGGTAGLDGANIFVGADLARLVVGGGMFESSVYAGRSLLDVSIAGDVGRTTRNGAASGSATGLAAVAAGIAGADGVYLDDPATEVDESADNVFSFVSGDFAVSVDAGADGVFFAGAAGGATTDDVVTVSVTAQDAAGNDVVLPVEILAGNDGVLFTADDAVRAFWNGNAGDGDIDEQSVLLNAAGFAGSDPTGFASSGDFRFIRLDVDGDGATNGDALEDNDVVLVQIAATDADGRVSVITGEIVDGDNTPSNFLDVGQTDRFRVNAFTGSANVLAAGDQIGASSVFGGGAGRISIGGSARDLQIIAGLDEFGNERAEESLTTGQRPGGVNFGQFEITRGADQVLIGPRLDGDARDIIDGFGGTSADEAAAIAEFLAFADVEADVVVGGAIIDGDGAGGQAGVVIGGNARDVKISAGIAAGFDGVYNTRDDQIVAGFGRVESVSFGSISNQGDVSVYTDRRNVVATVNGNQVQQVFTGGGAGVTSGRGVVSTTPGAGDNNQVRFGGDLLNVNPLAGRGELFAGDPLARPIDPALNALPATSTIVLPGGQRITVELTGGGTLFFDATPANAENPTLYVINTAASPSATPAPGASSLTLTYDAAASIGSPDTVELDIITNDDASLDSLTTVGFNLAGDSTVIVDFLVKDLSLAGFGDTTAFTIDEGRVIVGGDIQTLTLGTDGGTETITGTVSAAFVRSTVIFAPFGTLGSSLLTSDASLLFRGAGSVRVEGNLLGEVVVRRSISATNGIVGGEVAGVSVNGQVRRAVVRAGGSITNVFVNGTTNPDGSFADAVSESRFSVGENIGTFDVNNGNVFDTSIQAGGDLGFDGRPDNVTGNSDDRLTTGFITTVEVDGTFVESDIVVGALRGEDDFFGTVDDSLAAGLGTLGTVRILNQEDRALGDVLGSDNDSESYVIQVAGVTPPPASAITVGGINAQSINNFTIQPFLSQAEALEVTDVVVIREEGEIYVANVRFNQEVNFDTVANGLTVTQVLADGSEVVATLAGGQFLLEPDPDDRSVVRVVFARAVTQRDLEPQSRQSELNTAGLYRFDFADETSDAPLEGRIRSSRIDSDTTRSLFAVVGDAGDNTDGTPTDQQDGNAVVALSTGDQVDLYEGVNLDAAFTGSLATTGQASFTLRGITGDHPDEVSGAFGNAADVDRYYLSLEAGQILLIERDVLGAASDIERFLSPTSVGLFQQIDTAVPTLGSDTIADDFQQLETDFIQVHILESDTFVLTVSSDIASTIGTNVVTNNGLLLQSGGLSDDLNVNAAENQTSALGAYAFDIVIFDDGDSGFTSGQTVAVPLGGDLPEATDAGDGTELLLPSDFLTTAVNGLAGQDGIYAGSGPSAFDNLLPTAEDGDYTFIANPGADGVLYTADDIIRVEVDAEVSPGVTVPIAFDIRDGGNGTLLEAAGNDDIINLDVDQPSVDSDELNALRNLIIDELAGPDNQFVDNPATVADETGDNQTLVRDSVTEAADQASRVVVGDLTLSLEQSDSVASPIPGLTIGTTTNSDDVIFVEVNALSSDFVNLLPDLDLANEPGDRDGINTESDDFGSGFLYDAGSDGLFGTADDRIVVANSINDEFGSTFLTTASGSGSALVGRAAQLLGGADGDYATGADNAGVELVNGSFRATSSVGADGLLFTADDTVSVELETIDPVTGERSDLMTTGMTAAAYTIAAGVDGQLFTADDRLTGGTANDAAGFNALSLADGTELFGRVDGFDYVFTSLSVAPTNSIFAGGSLDESFDNLSGVIVADDAGQNAVGVSIDTVDGIAYNNDDVAVFQVTASRGGGETVDVAFAGVARGPGASIIDAGASGVITLSSLDLGGSLVGAGADGVLGSGFGVTQAVDLNLTNTQDNDPRAVVSGDFGRTVGGQSVSDVILLSPDTANPGAASELLVLPADGADGFGTPARSLDLLPTQGTAQLILAVEVADVDNTSGLGFDDVVITYVADTDADGLQDTAFVEVFEGTTGVATGPLPEFSARSFVALTPAAGIGIIDLELSDIDLDGDIDAVAIDSTGGVEILLNNGAGVFSNPFGARLLGARITPILPDIVNRALPNRLALADINNDGIEEAIIAGDNGVTVLNTATGVVTATLDAGAEPFSVDADDVNGDGLADIVVGNRVSRDPTDPRGEIAVLLSDSNNPGTFFAPVFFSAGVGPTQVVITDVDSVPERAAAASPLDILVVNASGSISTFLGNGDGIRQDADGDGVDDNGDGTFGPEIRSATGIGAGLVTVIESDVASPAAGATDVETGPTVVTFSDVTDQLLVLRQTASADDGILSLLAGPNGVYQDVFDAAGNYTPALSDNRFDLATEAVDLGVIGDFTFQNVDAGSDGLLGTNDDIITLDINNVSDPSAGAAATVTVQITAGADGVLLTADDQLSPGNGLTNGGVDGSGTTALVGALETSLQAGGALEAVSNAGVVSVNLFDALDGDDDTYVDVASTLNADSLFGTDSGGTTVVSGLRPSELTGSSGVALVTTVESAIGDVSAAGEPNSLFTDVDIFHIGGRQRIAAGSTVRVTVELDEIGSDIGGGLSSAGSTRATQAQLAIFDTTASTNIDDANLVLSPTDFSGRAFDEIPTITNDTPGFGTSYGLDDNGNFFVEFVTPTAVASGVSAAEGGTYAVYIQGQVQADYALRVEVAPTATPATPVLQQQNVFLEFNGGRIDWLLAGGQELEVQAFDAADLGFVGRTEDGDQLIEDFIITETVARVNTYFTSLSSFNEVTGQSEGLNIVVSDDPGVFDDGDFEFDEFSTIRVTSSASPFGFQSSESASRFLEDSILSSPLFGVTERSDPLNTDRDDEGVIFVGEYGPFSDVADPDTLDDFINSLGVTIVRQVGELLGLRLTTSLVTQNSAFGALALADTSFRSQFIQPAFNPVTIGGISTDINGDGFPDDLTGDGFADFPTGIPNLPGVNTNQTRTSIDPLSGDAPTFAFDLVDLPATQIFGDTFGFLAGERGDRALVEGMPGSETTEYFFPVSSSPVSDFLLGQQSSELLLDRILETSS
ncbi:MAG: VCBS repeat-containing protein [Planctomycetota bacterium]